MGLALVVASTYDERQSGKGYGRASARLSALNITLFPPLFFFSALYYTDVASTFSVLIFYYYFVRSRQRQTHALVRVPILLVLGLTSLLFRQTNIFWVAIFPAGIILIEEIDKGHEVVKHSMHRRVEGFGDSYMSVARTSWKLQVVYDPSVCEAGLEGNRKSCLY